MKELNKLNLTDKKYIIFDMDGTLIDSIGVWNLTDKKLIEEYGGKISDLETIQNERDNFLHNNEDSDIYVEYCKYLIEKNDLSIKDPKELLNIRWNKSSEILEKEIDFKDDVVSLILRLKELGFILVLATMTTKVQLDIYSKKNKKMLSKMNIADVFDLITDMSDVTNKKPNPEIYLKVMEYYNAEPSECLVFEDSYTGVLASNKAGIEVVNIYDRYADVDRKRINELTDYSIEGYDEFLEFVNDAFKGSAKVKKIGEYHNMCVKRKWIIIAGYSGTGKTTFAKKYKNVIDLDASEYVYDETDLLNIDIERRKGEYRKPNPNWPGNYIEGIKKALDKYDIVLVCDREELQCCDADNLIDIVNFLDANNIYLAIDLDSLAVYKVNYKIL